MIGKNRFTKLSICTAFVASAAAMLSACGPDVIPAPDMEVLSSKPEFVSGGDALVSVKVKNAGAQVRAALNGADVSSAFKKVSDDVWVGTVSGMKLGANTLVTDSGGASSTVNLTNFPITGPIFSGPQQKPFACQTATFRIYPGGPFLGAEKDANCSVDTRVDYVYLNTAKPAAFVGLANVKEAPKDAATVTGADGKSSPFVVRIETGTVNRSIYQTAMLHNPATSDAPNAFLASPIWNKKLVYTFGGGCTGGWYRQGNTTGGVLDTPILALGYAMASSSLNVFGNQCGDLLAAESMAMVKERFIEAYGKPKFTIGWGCSGGSYQQHQIADNYPGLLDGILPGCSFPEVGFATVNSITDMRLLGNYFQNTAPGTVNDDKQKAVAGALLKESIYTSTVYRGALRIAPDEFCPAELPVALRYNAQTNPTGVRCSVYDQIVNVLGKDPTTGFPRRPLDNVGIQYGLRALNRGQISVDEFLTINEKVGGYDLDARFQAARNSADLIATKQAYQTGRLTSGGGGLKDVPIIDYRGYSDDNPVGDIHQRYHSFSMRERLVKANGSAANQVMVVEDFRYGYYASTSPLLMKALNDMDKWITAIQADANTGSAFEKVVRNKPSTLVEGCNTRDAQPTFIAETQQMESGKCAAIYPVPGAPRYEAGASIAADIIKCTLKPIAATDYKVTLTAEQNAKLTKVFSTGVCNWAVAGAEQQGLRGTWLSFN
jgi:hypothetical protein